MSCIVSWIETFSSALLVPLIACIAALIAYWQWKTAQNKLKLDLFDKRLAVYEGVTSFIAHVFQTGKVTDDEVRAYMQATRNAKWLFSEEVASYLNSIYEKAIDIQAYRAQLEGVPVGDRRTELVNKESSAKKWLVAQFSVVDEHFRNYMEINH
ncbi:hypothetical protein [Endozoicomonas sp. ALD040]|uniref:hypothetical protein n=1 Tax=Endozoicomonas sp. ALD040 TaxID=3403079 RepID=UPI003BB1C524